MPGLDADGRRDGPAFSASVSGHLPFPATNVDNNADRVTTFFAAHPGQFYCNECLSIEAVPGLNKTQVNRLTHLLRDATPYRKGEMVCVSCDQVRACIAHGSPRADDPFQSPPKHGNPS